MTLITTLVMQDDRRGESSKKQPLRLPIIAPKDDLSSSASSSRSGHLGFIGPAVPPRARLPPRSRTGCWTCRTRKVKCDEGRPICGQCTRLGHVCDYNPRLAFRDDTPRVLERMQDVTIVTSSVWDCQYKSCFVACSVADSFSATSPSMTEASTGSVAADDLPPFALLTTDEDREKKAERSSAGTYNVVVNQESFQHLPEYNDDAESRKEFLSPLRRGSVATSLTSSLGRDSSTDTKPSREDPNVIVLSRFEDISRRGTFSSNNPRSPLSPTAKHTIIKDEDPEEAIMTEEPDLIDTRDSSQDAKYLDQIRHVVWKQLVPAEPDQRDGMVRSSVNVLEAAANVFAPVSTSNIGVVLCLLSQLYHAMMAVAALSLSFRDENERLAALQHYQQALPALQNSLRSPHDLSSDGAFLTHFLLLVYEVSVYED